MSEGKRNEKDSILPENVRLADEYRKTLKEIVRLESDILYKRKRLGEIQNIFKERNYDSRQLSLEA